MQRRRKQRIAIWTRANLSKNRDRKKGEGGRGIHPGNSGKRATVGKEEETVEAEDACRLSSQD
jgi:hypothetical protein